MSAVSYELRGARRPAIRWLGLATVVLLAACGGEGRETGDAQTGGGAISDSAPPAAANTATPAATDTSAAGAAGDTAKQQAQRPAAPAAPTKPAAPPKPAATPKPTKPAAPAQDTAATAAATPDTATPAAETAAAQGTAASGQDTAAAAEGAASGQTQTADAPLRDQYHQAPKDTVEQATYDGWKQYNLNCARCHGEDVLGSTIAPHLIMSLKPDGPIDTPEKFTEVVCAGRPEKGMPSWCALGLEPAKISQIYSYVKGRSEGKLRPGRPAVKPEG